MKQHSLVQGFTLLEVMITVLILGIGLLGIAALQNASIKSNQSAFDRTQAVIFMDSMQEVMRANRPQARLGAFNKTCSGTVPSGGIAGTELTIWHNQLRQKLGNTACGEVSCNANICEVRIQWDDSRGIQGSNTMSMHTRFSL
jgi:type IV pilus assembly protein PilV